MSIRRERAWDPHLELARSSGISCRVVSVQLIVKLDVKVASILVVGLVGQVSSNRLALFDGEYFSEIEDGLFPMRVLGMWPRGEADGFVAGGEVNVEPGNECVDEVIPLRPYLEGFGESELCSGDGVQVDCEDGAWICDESFHLHRIDKRLAEGRFLHG